MPPKGRGGRGGRGRGKGQRGKRRVKQDEIQAKGLVIGINYTDSKYELKGCHNDAKNVAAKFHQMAKSAGIEDVEIKLVTDKIGPKPTRAGILALLAWLVEGAERGDVLYFHFSGHGGQVADRSGDEKDGKDECIWAMDMKPVIDDELNRILVGMVPKGVTCYYIFDCCHSGTIMDLRNVYDEEEDSFSKDTHKRQSKAQIFMISGCLNVQTSADLPAGYKGQIKESQGALSNALLSCMDQGLSWADMVTTVRCKISKNALKQIPQFETGRGGKMIGPHAVAFAHLVPKELRGKKGKKHQLAEDEFEAPPKNRRARRVKEQEKGEFEESDEESEGEEVNIDDLEDEICAGMDALEVDEDEEKEE